jgi:hypothetical protein
LPKFTLPGDRLLVLPGPVPVPVNEAVGEPQLQRKIRLNASQTALPTLQQERGRDSAGKELDKVKVEGTVLPFIRYDLFVGPKISGES